MPPQPIPSLGPGPVTPDDIGAEGKSAPRPQSLVGSARSRHRKTRRRHSHRSTAPGLDFSVHKARRAIDYARRHVAVSGGRSSSPVTDNTTRLGGKDCLSRRIEKVGEVLRPLAAGNGNTNPHVKDPPCFRVHGPLKGGKPRTAIQVPCCSLQRIIRHGDANSMLHQTVKMFKYIVLSTN